MRFLSVLLFGQLLSAVTAQTCRDGTPGLEDGNACCTDGCLSCNSNRPRCGNRSAPLGASDCCSDQVLADNNLCSDTGEAPCVLGDVDTVCETNGFAGFEGTTRQGTPICCTNGCGQCGGNNCESNWDPLDEDDCCAATINQAGNLCSVTGEAPCIIDNEICPVGSSICDDPHMRGLRGQRINWFGVDGGWYSFVRDDDLDLNVNVKLTAPLPEEFPNRQLVTGLSVISGGHSVVVEVTDPYEVDTNNGCPDGMAAPCLANGGLTVTVDGKETADDSPLLHPVRGELLPGGHIEVSAVNLPVECWQFGGDKIWARHQAEKTALWRRRASEETFEEWILSFNHMSAHDWCTQYIAEKSLLDVQSAHAIYQIVTPEVVVRLNVGIGHEGGGEDWDGRELPELDVWQMDVGLAGLNIDNEALTGILGETARPVIGEDGKAVMKGRDAYRGTVEDYRVSGGLGTDFALLHQK